MEIIKQIAKQNKMRDLKLISKRSRNKERYLTILLFSSRGRIEANKLSFLLVIQRELCEE